MNIKSSESKPLYKIMMGESEWFGSFFKQARFDYLNERAAAACRELMEWEKECKSVLSVEIEECVRSNPLRIWHIVVYVDDIEAVTYLKLKYADIISQVEYHG